MSQPVLSLLIDPESIDITDSQRPARSVKPGPECYYATLDELVFALINFSLALEADLGSA